ncbi:MAG: GTPase HflX [Thermoanaerobaculales bacterium]|jgi:GTP-binding protein HflX|nr:GTPase HflX [Thermoanaerobaculales bacterium]
MSRSDGVEVRASGAEPVVLVGLVVAGAGRSEVDEHLDELERLVDTAGGRVVERLVQERAAPDPATLVGSGFVTRVAERAAGHEARSVIFDEDLTASQIRNLEREMPKDVKVLDRAAVILDIFAARARSREAKTQVELAQLSYLLPRLTRRWGHLSRQAGGIGTRGVGETQLEIDRRLVSRRIAQLKAKLAVIERDRRLRRGRRNELPSVALVGYTNAGKSSLFRRLSRADVLVEDRLFATLDPRTRRVSLGEEVTAVLTDTVGFIRKLPHDLVAPFRSTLEEAVESDLVLHVVDAAHPAWEEHLRIGDEVLEGLGVAVESQLVVLNKCDLLAGPMPVVAGDRPALAVSAVTGAGMPGLRSAIRDRLLTGPGVAILRVPLDEAEMVRRALGMPHQLARRYGREAVELAMRVDAWRLDEVGLGGYRVTTWGGVAEGGA